jgi:hypothetical protein
MAEEGELERLIRERLEEAYKKRAWCPCGGVYIMHPDGSDRRWCPICGRVPEEEEES